MWSCYFGVGIEHCANYIYNQTRNEKTIVKHVISMKTSTSMVWVWQSSTSLVKSLFFYLSSTSSSTRGTKTVLVNCLAKQLYMWCSLKHALTESHARLTRASGSWEKLLFSAPSPIHPLWEGVLRSSSGGAVLFYPVWHKTAPNSFWSWWRSCAKWGLSNLLQHTYWLDGTCPWSLAKFHKEAVPLLKN